MRIAHVVSTFPPHIGGMGMIAYNEAKILADYEHDVTVFTLQYSNMAYDDAKFPFKVVRLKPLIRMGDAGLVPQILQFLKGFDLVHLHYPFYGGAEWLSFSSLPLVITYHMDAQAGGMKAGIQKAYDSFWPKILFGQAKKIIAVDMEHFKNTKFGQDFAYKTVEIPNGVDTEVFSPHAVDLASLDLAHLTGKQIILFVGNLLPLKRLDLLLEAIKLLADDNLALVVVGSGYELDKYQELAKKLQIESMVNFVGQCNDRQKLSNYYNAATAVVVPSDYESFSLVAAEAMACAVPVIASNIPGVAGRIKPDENGFFFEKGSTESLAAALKKVLALSSEDKKAIGEKARAEVKAKYSWQQHMEKLASLYNNLV